MTKNYKDKVLAALCKSNNDLNIEEVANLSKISRTTTSKYLGILVAEGEAEISRRIGRAVLYRAKR